MSRKTRTIKNFITPRKLRFHMEDVLRGIDIDATRMSNEELFDNFMANFGHKVKPIYIRDTKHILKIKSKYKKGGSYEKV